ncbi:hypothetical protein, partial [Streptomyces osmaniensis]|uniref:hypothetical protein n=1 Tax=Streptomyces osmaniensis TaxID=593134 RepID=UPI0031FE01BF
GDDNNVAGNDLVVGNNHTSGTGHSIGQPQDGLSQATVNVYNCSGSTLNLTDLANNPRTNGEWLSPAATPPSSIASHPATLDGNQCVNYGVSANWTSATTVPALTSTALYNIAGSQGSIEFDASAGTGVQDAVSADCPTIGTTLTCDWLKTATVGAGQVRAVVSFIIVPGA